MFGALNQGSTLYVLDKTGNEPKMNIATITAKTELPMSAALWNQTLPNTTIDITVSYADGTTNTFQKLPVNNSIYAYEKAVVTETREQMQMHIENAIRQSKAVIDSIDYHKRSIVAYEDILKKLSPMFAKERETDDRLSAVEKGLGDIKNLLVQMSSNNSSSSKYSNQKN